MELGLSGNVVAVFGAASGIGAAIARAFAAEGRGLRPSTSTRASSILQGNFPGQSVWWTMSVIMLRSVVRPRRSPGDWAM